MGLSPSVKKFTKHRMCYKSASDAVQMLNMHRRIHCMQETVIGAMTVVRQEQLTYSY